MTQDTDTGARDPTDVLLAYITRLNLSYANSPRWQGLDEAWLSARLRMLRQLLIPSLRSQRDQEFTWLVLVHPATPESALEQVCVIPQCRVLKTKSDLTDFRLLSRQSVDYLYHHARRSLLVTVRLDSDDGVNPIHGRTLKSFAARQVVGAEGIFTDFPHGSFLNLDTGYGYVRYSSSRSCGISRIERFGPEAETIYCDHHERIRRRHNFVSLDTYEPMWVQTHHEFHIDRPRKRLPEIRTLVGTSAEVERMIRIFPFLGAVDGPILTRAAVLRDAGPIESLVSLGRLPEALAALDHFLRLQQGEMPVECRRSIAKILDRLGFSSSAQCAYQSASRTDDQLSLAGTIQCMLNQGRVETALAVSRSVPVEAIVEPTLLASMVFTAQKAGDYALIEEMLKGPNMAHLLTPDVIIIAAKIALYVEKDYELVARLADVYVDDCGTQLGFLGAVAKIEARDFESALGDITLMINSEPPAPDAFLAGYEILRRQQRFGAAQSYLDQLLELYGMSATVPGWVGSCCDLRSLEFEHAEATGDGRLVSIVMTVHRWNEMLTRAVQSILRQTHENLELIIVIDGPAEVDRINSAIPADHRISVINLSRNVGTYCAKNEGLDLCTGSIVTFTDSDDLYHPQRIENALRILDSCENEAVAVCDNEIRFGLDGSIVNRSGYFSILKQTSLLMSLPLFREHLGYFDNVRMGADSEMCSRIESAFGNGSVYSSGSPAIFSYDHGMSLTGGGSGWIDWRGVTGDRFTYMKTYQQWHRRIRALEMTTYIGKSSEPRSSPQRYEPGIGAAEADGGSSARFKARLAAGYPNIAALLGRWPFER